MKNLHSFDKFNVSKSDAGEYFLEMADGTEFLLLSPSGSGIDWLRAGWIENPARTESDFEAHAIEAYLAGAMEAEETDDTEIDPDSLDHGQVAYLINAKMGERWHCIECGSSYAILNGQSYYNGHNGDGWFRTDGETPGECSSGHDPVFDVEKIEKSCQVAADRLVTHDRIPVNPVVRLYADRVEIDSDIHKESENCLAEITTADFVDYFCGDVSQYKGIENLTQGDIIDGFGLVR